MPPAYTGDNFGVELIGRVQTDITWADADVSTAELSDIELRRLRAGLSGWYGSSIKYKLEIEIKESGDVLFTDAYLKFKPASSPVGLIAGQFKTPNALDNLTSSRFGSTFERAAFINAFGFDRRIGAGVYTEGERYHVTAGVFGETLEEDPLSSGYAIAGRAVVIPIKTDDMLLHLGGSVRYREQEDGDLVRYRERPYAHQFGRILATPAITDSDMFAGLEAAALYKNFWLAGEYATLSGDCDACGEDYNADGKYIEAGVFFGGKRGYKSFAFSRPQVDSSVLDGGLGAISVLARYDALDLRDEPVDGGELDTVILGAEWWPISNAKVGLNFFRTKARLGDVVAGVDDAFAAIIMSGATKETVKGVTLRMQVDL